MKKTKALSLLLCLSLLCALLVPGPAAHADAADSGVNISKTATANADGSYTITLEAFATGSKTTIVQEKDIPTDIILVLDQSTSMAEGMGQVQYTQYTGNDTRNETNFENRHNGGYANLWYKLPDGSYVSVSVTLLQMIVYNPMKSSNTRRNRDYWRYQNNLYTYVNRELKKVVCTRERDDPSQNWHYKYALEDGTILNENSGGETYSPTFENTDDGYLYLAAERPNENVYTYTYTDASGTPQTIGISTGARTEFTPAFYQRGRTNSGGSRLNALKTAAADFVNAVAAKAAGPDAQIGTNDDINHRIAVVGFASESGNGNNTELLSIEGNNSGSVGVAYNSITDQNLIDVLQSMNTQNGQNMVNAAINALAANGTTRTDLGMEMAQRILNANPVPAGKTRNRVVIVFTDGSPTSSNGIEKGIAYSAISNANEIKAGGTTVYSIGIFSGADASTAGVEPDGDLIDYGDGDKYYTEAQMSAACNWFMQNVSSNYGTPRTPSYYLSVGDSPSLSSIFHQISGQIETGGSETTLGSNTVVKDIIAPAFTLSDGETPSSIQINIYDCTGKNGNSYTWATTSGGNDGVTATVNGDQVSVTGFNFSENWCGIEKDAQGTETVRGKKLVISFTVKLKSGFLGGNDVPTNADAGIYKDGTTDYPVLRFEKPTVNVPIQDVTVTAAEKNVYLLGNVTADDLKSGATVKVGDNITLDLSKANDTDKPYGLEPWQTEYVNITVTVKDANNNVISAPLSSLTNDTTYTVEVTVSPKTSGSTTTQGTPATAKTGTGTANINVFKPALTFKDSDVYYGDNAPADYSGSLTATQWKRGETLSSSVTMTGTAPYLGLTCAPEAGKIASGKINTKQDIAVDVAVKIGTADVTADTTFIHTGCADKACTLPAGKEFLLHVKTCQLTVTKAGGADDESYVFTVMKDGAPYSEVSIEGNNSQTIYELPVGTYTITENTGWRYSASYSGDATLSATTPGGTITCTNTKNNDQWLNGFSAIVRNTFGQNH